MSESSAPPVRSLDLRALDPPEPMRRALEATEALAAGERVEIITDREPSLLYRELGRRGHVFVSERVGGAFRTTIRRGQERALP